MASITELLFWKRNLGHLPIHLTPLDEDKFLMLNGINGNFCLHISNDADNINTYFSQSWSSNTKNFLLVNENNIKLYNWHKDVKEETIAIKSVLENTEKFYQYLIAKSLKSERDVVPFVIDIFKQFRTLTAEAGNPIQALNLLFLLLASLEEENIADLNKEKWGILDNQIPVGLEPFIERFKSGFGNIIPDLNLILRHSAGALFQEAQKEVIFFNNQLDIFGTFSGEMETREILYSSIHYTPSYLARTIVENSLKIINLEDLQEIKILDPACGSGEFLIEVLKQLKEKEYKGKIQITGLDSSETAVNTSNFLLTYEKRVIWDNQLEFDISKVTDSLTEDWDNDFTLVLMNPPFTSWELLNSTDGREAVREALGASFKGKPNQASAFFYKAVNHIAPDGVLGCVIPTSLFTMDSYQKLRDTVYSILNFELIGKLGNFVFEDAITDASIIVGKKPKENGIMPTILWTRNEKGIVHEALRELRKLQNSDNISKDRVDFSIFKTTNFPLIPNSWKPISLKEHNLINDLSRFIATGKLSLLSDIFDVQQGIRTGNNDVFKVDYDLFLQLPEEEKKYFRSVIENTSVTNGFLKKGRYIWFPYDNEGLMIADEVDLAEKAKYFYTNYLLPHKLTLQNRAGINVWWELTRPRNWQFEKRKKLVSTEFGNSSSFAIDSKGDYVVERGHAWQPKKKLKTEDYFFYLALFTSPFFDRLLSIYSKQLAGGKWYDLGKNRTKYIPIPNVHLDEVKNSSSYSRLVDLGKRLSEGDSYVKAILNEVLSIYYPSEIL